MSWKVSQKGRTVLASSVIALVVLCTVATAWALAPDATAAAFDPLHPAQAGCYNGQRDGDETGIDCGGSCPLDDCCANRAWDADLGELGIDCDGSCPRPCRAIPKYSRPL